MYNERQKIWQRENRQMMVKCHLCRDCGKQDAWTLKGHNYCFECNEKRNEKGRAWREKHKEEINAKRREKYIERKAENRCPRCGRKLVFLDKVLCAHCAAKDSNNFKAHYERKRVGWVCTQCCKAPPIPGKKLCQSCYDKNMVKLQTMWQRRGLNVECKQG